VLPEVAEPDAAVEVDLGGVERLAVEGDLRDRGAHQVDERLGTRLGGAEGDRRGAVEGALTGGQVELHGVGVDVDQPGAGLRLVTGQIGSRHAVHHCTDA
jgi:hypothetical protein